VLLNNKLNLLMKDCKENLLDLEYEDAIEKDSYDNM
jgi:hypothetical protein